MVQSTLKTGFQFAELLNKPEIKEVYKHFAKQKNHFDLQNIDSEQANLLLLCNYIAQSDFIHFLFAPEILEFAKSVSKEVTTHQKIIEMIAKKEITEEQILEYIEDKAHPNASYLISLVAFSKDWDSEQDSIWDNY